MSVAGCARAPGGHEEQEGSGAGGAAVSLPQPAALLPAQVTAWNKVPTETEILLQLVATYCIMKNETINSCKNSPEH